MISSGILRHVSPSSQNHSSPALVRLTLNFVCTTSALSQHFLNGKRGWAASVTSAFRYHSCTSAGWFWYSGFHRACDCVAKARTRISEIVRFIAQPPPVMPADDVARHAGRAAPCAALPLAPPWQYARPTLVPWLAETSRCGRRGNVCVKELLSCQM